LGLAKPKKPKKKDVGGEPKKGEYKQKGVNQPPPKVPRKWSPISAEPKKKKTNLVCPPNPAPFTGKKTVGVEGGGGGKRKGNHKKKNPKKRGGRL